MSFNLEEAMKEGIVSQEEWDRYLEAIQQTELYIYTDQLGKYAIFTADGTDMVLAYTNKEAAEEPADYELETISYDELLEVAEQMKASVVINPGIHCVIEDPDGVRSMADIDMDGVSFKRFSDI